MERMQILADISQTPKGRTSMAKVYRVNTVPIFSVSPDAPLETAFESRTVQKVNAKWNFTWREEKSMYKPRFILSCCRRVVRGG